MKTTESPARSGLREERCSCGSLVAMLSPRGVEILCRRCKRIHPIPWIKEETFDALIQD